jgi:hypothetical protein
MDSAAFAASAADISMRTSSGTRVSCRSGHRNYRESKKGRPKTCPFSGHAMRRLRSYFSPSMNLCHASALNAITGAV